MSQHANDTNTGDVPSFELHHRLARALEHGGVTVLEMAEAIGYSEKQTRNYLRGDQTPRSGTIAAWALRSGVNYRWLASGDLPGETPDGTPATHGNPLVGWNYDGAGHDAEVVQLRRAS